MRVIKLTRRFRQRVLKEAKNTLRSGGIVIGPTDTVYGIFGDAREPKVIKKIFLMKKRPNEKAFPIFVKDIAMAKQYAYISKTQEKFLQKVWPGAVTIVFRKKKNLPQILTGGKDTIGIRIPKHKFMLELLEKLNFPLVQTSANISGLPPAKNIREIKKYFARSKVKPDLIIDGGEIRTKPSTVIDFTEEKPVVLRKR